MAAQGGTTNGHSNGATANGQSNGNAAPSLPESRPVQYAPGQTLLPPLSRRGEGPGLIVVLPEEGSLKAPGKFLGFYSTRLHPV